MRLLIFVAHVFMRILPIGVIVVGIVAIDIHSCVSIGLGHVGAVVGMRRVGKLVTIHVARTKGCIEIVMVVRFVIEYICSIMLQVVEGVVLSMVLVGSVDLEGILIDGLLDSFSLWRANPALLLSHPDVHKKVLRGPRKLGS